MALTRTELRKKAMIILYQLEILNNIHVEVNVEDLIKENLDTDNEFVKDIVYGVITYKEQIDKLANEKMIDWDISRIDKTGATIMRMGIFELLYTDTPDVVVINEAVELAKIYSDDNVKNMVNAVLDKISKEKPE